jgi:hypothetical protein
MVRVQVGEEIYTIHAGATVGEVQGVWGHGCFLVSPSKHIFCETSEILPEDEILRVEFMGKFLLFLSSSPTPPPLLPLLLSLSLLPPRSSLSSFLLPLLQLFL